jgi:conjugative transfer region protein (TIGR03750 family)
MEAHPQPELLADRLNSEPLIFKGCTHSELGLILVGAVLFWVPTALLLTSMLGVPMLGLGLSGVGIIATIVLGATLFQRIKRGRPDHYFQHLVNVKATEIGLIKSNLILRSGPWSLGRQRF